MATYSKLAVEIPPKMYRDLTEYCHKNSTPRTHVVRRLIEAFLVELESKPSGKMFANKKDATKK